MQLPIKSLTSPITKTKHQPPSILSLPNDALASILRKALETSPVSVLGKEINEITTVATLTDVSPTFKSNIVQSNLTEERGVEHIDLAYPFTFFQATKHLSIPSFAESFIKSEQHRFIGKSLRTAILHPLMSGDIHHSLLTQISSSAVSISHISFTDGYGYDAKEILCSMPFEAEMELSQLSKLESIEVNIPSFYLLKLLSNSFCSVSKISLHGVLPSTLTEVLHVVRSRYYRSKQTEISNDKRLPSCCKLTELQLSVKMSQTDYASERSIEVEKVRDFVTLIKNKNIPCLRTLKRITLRFDDAPGIIDEMTTAMQSSFASSWIVPIDSDIELLGNEMWCDRYVNFRRKSIPETARAWMCNKSTSLGHLCTVAREGRSEREVERCICKSVELIADLFEFLQDYGRLRQIERQWIMNMCVEYGNSIKKLEVSLLHKKNLAAARFNTICSFLQDMSISLSNLCGISLHWYIFDHITHGQGTLNEQDTLTVLNTFPSKTQWFEILIHHGYGEFPEWKQKFMNNFVTVLPMFIATLIRCCPRLKTIILTEQVKRLLPTCTPEKSLVQRTKSSIEDIEKKNPLLDLSSVTNYLVTEKDRSH